MMYDGVMMEMFDAITSSSSYTSKLNGELTLPVSENGTLIEG